MTFLKLTNGISSCLQELIFPNLMLSFYLMVWRWWRSTIGLQIIRGKKRRKKSTTSSFWTLSFEFNCLNQNHQEWAKSFYRATWTQDAFYHCIRWQGGVQCIWTLKWNPTCKSQNNIWNQVVFLMERRVGK